MVRDEVRGLRRLGKVLSRFPLYSYGQIAPSGRAAYDAAQSGVLKVTQRILLRFSVHKLDAKRLGKMWWKRAGQISGKYINVFYDLYELIIERPSLERGARNGGGRTQEISNNKMSLL